MYEISKRLFDIVASSIALALLLPPFVVLALLIKLDSKGPVFYRALRAGRSDKPFKIFKFRTMVPDAESLGGMSTAQNDPRVTRLGGVLRRSKLDELPQLINVLAGNMSVVGPRPEMPAYTRLYQGEEKLILTVRPGITDYASLEFVQLGDVLGAEDADRVYEEKVRPIKNALRVRYVKERSMRVDFQLIFRTIFRIIGSVSGRGVRPASKY